MKGRPACSRMRSVRTPCLETPPPSPRAPEPFGGLRHGADTPRVILFHVPPLLSSSAIHQAHSLFPTKLLWEQLVLLTLPCMGCRLPVPLYACPRPTAVAFGRLTGTGIEKQSHYTETLSGARNPARPLPTPRPAGLGPCPGQTSGSSLPKGTVSAHPRLFRGNAQVPARGSRAYSVRRGWCTHAQCTRGHPPRPCATPALAGLSAAVPQSRGRF